MKNLYNNIQAWFSKLTNMKYFNIVYPMLIALVALIGWRFSSLFGFIALIIIGLIFLAFTKDFNYIISEILYFIFVINGGFANDSIPVTLLVVASIFVIAILSFIIYKIVKNGFNLKKMKSLYGLIGLALINFIPIFWADIPKGNEVFYFFFIANVGYLLLYFLVTSGMEKTNKDLIIYSFIGMGLLISFQVFIQIGVLGYTFDDVFGAWYHLGWGLCNEGGIMICFSLPFVFYKMYDAKGWEKHTIHLYIILIMALGVLFTTSRGALLCFALELLVGFVVLFIKGKDKRFNRNFVLGLLGASIVLFFALYKFTFPLVEKIINTIFSNGLDSNGRTDIWQKGLTAFTKNPLTIILGPGMCSVLETRLQGTAGGGFVEILTPLVMHSTFVETLVMGGIVGIVALGFHFYQKYKIMYKEGLPFFLTIGLGMIALDLYGMIDNTYHMYYYMIPLCVLLASLDNIKLEEVNDTCIGLTNN